MRESQNKTSCCMWWCILHVAKKVDAFWHKDIFLSTFMLCSYILAPYLCDIPVGFHNDDQSLCKATKLHIFTSLNSKWNVDHCHTLMCLKMEEWRAQCLLLKDIPSRMFHRAWAIAENIEVQPREWVDATGNAYLLCLNNLFCWAACFLYTLRITSEVTKGLRQERKTVPATDTAEP